MKNAVKTLEDLSQDEEMRNAIEQTQKNIAEYNARMMEAENKGIEKVALNMLKANSDVEFISEVTGLSKEEIQKLSK